MGTIVSYYHFRLSGGAVRYVILGIHGVIA